MEFIMKSLLNITQKINDLDISLNNRFDILETRLNKIENKMMFNTDNKECIEDLKELVKENIEMDRNTVLKALSYKDYRSILMIFKLYYKNENNATKYPIRVFKVRKFEYYANKKWNADLYGTHSIEVLIGNIQDLFIRHNDMEEIGYEKFISYQDFIQKLDDDKVRKNIFKAIAEEIRD